MSKSFENATEQAAEAIKTADALWIGAGAGMGVDSGLPDFRGNEGFWKAYPPFRKLGLNFYDLANPRWFLDDPKQAWGFYGHRRNLYRLTQPHQGFEILLDWARQISSNYFVFTSNVDGHFHRAGFDEDRIIECHGAIDFMQCTYRCRSAIWKAEANDIVVDDDTMRAIEPLPTCQSCEQIARPNILMFGDGGWIDDRANRQHARYQRWLQENINNKVVGIEFGAGTAVPTVRWEAEARTDVLIRVNPREPEGPHGTISIAAGAMETIQELNKWL